MGIVQQSSFASVVITGIKSGSREQVKSEWRGILLVIASAFCFSSAIIFARFTNGLSPIQLAFFRAFFAFLFFALLLPKYRQSLNVRAYRGSILRLAGLGLAVGATSALFIYALQNTTAGNASLLVNSAPMYVALLAPRLLKEPSARLILPSVCLALVGTFLISNPSQLQFESRSFGGIVAGILAGFTFALTMLFSRSLRKQVSGHTQILWSSGIASMMLLPWALQSSPQVVLSNVEFLLPLGVISLGIAYLCNFLGLGRVNAQVASVTALFEPASSVMIGLVLFGEMLSPLNVMGAILILASIYLISR